MRKKRTYYSGAALKETRVKNACVKLSDLQRTITADGVFELMKFSSTANDFTRQEVIAYLKKATYLKETGHKMIYNGYSKQSVRYYEWKT